MQQVTWVLLALLQQKSHKYTFLLVRSITYKQYEKIWQEEDLYFNIIIMRFTFSYCVLCVCVCIAVLLFEERSLV